MPVSKSKNKVQFEQSSFDLWGASTETVSPSLVSVTAKPKTIEDANLAIEPSHYQRAIFDFVLADTKENGLVQAVPGSGKTTTLREAVKLLPPDKTVLMVAYNKHIAKELQEKLKQAGLFRRSHPLTGKQSVSVQTVHGLGYTTLANYLSGRHNSSSRKLNLEEGKYDQIVLDLIFERGLPKNSYWPSTVELLRVCQLTLTDPHDWDAMEAMIAHYDLGANIAFKETAFALVIEALERGQELAETKQIISYDDMIWLPNVWDLQPEKYDWVFCDESQDLSRAQLELVLRCQRPGIGRFLFVGDENQSIFGFNCADTDGKKRILERTQATELPLSISYRCPASHVELAATIYPVIEAAPNAKPGLIRYDVTDADLLLMVQPNDLVICRTTAPLLPLCFKLLRKGIKAKMRGRDIGRTLKAIVTQLENELKGKGTNLESFDFASFDFVTWLKIYEERQIEAAEFVGLDELKIETLRDKVEAVKIICQSTLPSPKTTTQLKSAIGELFADDGDCIWFSTVHRAKGSEARNVWILKPELIPHPMAKLGWQRVQEKNCEYVAYTRAKETLYFVKS